MPLHLAVVQLIGGVVWLLVGGEFLVRGAMALSRRARISPIVVGLTVVAIGTSAPELVVSLRAALIGYPELAIANVVGSNIANVLLVVGLPAIVYPMVCDQPSVARDGLIMLLVSVAFAVLCYAGPLSRSDGLLLLIGLLAFFVYAARARSPEEPGPDESEEFRRVLGLPSKPIMIAVLIGFGSTMLPVGADLLIDSTVSMAANFGVSNAVLGVTVIALSTSLPELATTLVAAVKRQADVAVGNVLGSNILNILAIMGAATVASPADMAVPTSFLRLDLPLMLAAATVLGVVALRRATVGRGLGIVLFAAYLVYLGVLYRGVGA